VNAARNIAWQSRGFTLLEMLIGLVLVGFVMVLLFAGLRLGIRSWDAGEARNEASAQRMLVVNFLRRTLEQATPLRWKLEGVDALAFSGASDSLDFYGPIAARSGLSGNQLLSLRLQDAPDHSDSPDSPDSGGDLVLFWRFHDPRKPGFTPLDEAESKVLAQRVRAFELAYFGAESTAAEAQWHDQWRDKLALPRLIRLRLTLADGEVWSEIVVAPRLAGYFDE
jgi:general secretion pathway protein J